MTALATRDLFMTELAVQPKISARDNAAFFNASDAASIELSSLAAPRHQNDDGIALSALSSGAPAARLRRGTRKFVGTVRRNQYQREQSLLQQLDDAGDIRAFTENTGDTVDSDVIQNPSELRSMTTLSLHQKKSLLNRMRHRFSQSGTNRSETLKRLKSGFDSKVRLARNQISGAMYTLGIWKGHLKELQGHFGTDVTAYFVFLRWLFLANFFTGFIVILFLFVPQFVHRFQPLADGPYGKANFSGMDLLTGKGWFLNAKTEMYYGFYSNTSLKLSSLLISLPDLPYNIPWAYLLTMGAYVGVFFITMAVSTAKSYRQNYIEGSSEFRFYYVAKILVGWDCGILDSSAAKERKKSLLRELQEYVSSIAKGDGIKKCSRVMGTVLGHLCAVLIQIGIICGAGAGLYYLIYEYKIGDQSDLRELAISLLITAINGILPFVFSLVSKIQKFETEMQSILSTLIMTCLLYCSSLGSFLGASLIRTANGSQRNNGTNSTYAFNSSTKSFLGSGSDLSNECVETWETRLGYLFYQLAVIDFLFTIALMLFVEGVHRLIAKMCSKHITAPRFDIARNTQSLMLSQVLCWLGIYYCPMIIVVTVIKMVVLFYLKRYFIKLACVPNTKHWKGTQMQTWFLIILFIFFILCCVHFGFIISVLPPSSHCGPFRDQACGTPVDLILLKGDRVINLIVSPGTMVVVIVSLCVAAHYMRVVSSGKKELVHLLREQITLECKDKVFLQKLLEQIQKAKLHRKMTKRTRAPIFNDRPSDSPHFASSNPRPLSEPSAGDDRDSAQASQLTRSHDRNANPSDHFCLPDADPATAVKRKVFIRERNTGRPPTTAAAGDEGGY